MIDIRNLSKNGLNLEYFVSGQVIIREGETTCDKMYILLDGNADVFKNYQQPGQVQVASLSQGDFFGEMSLFLNKGRTATVVAADDLTALTVDGTNAYDFFKNQPEAAYSLIQTLCSRLDKTNMNMADGCARYEESISLLNNEKSELEIAANIDPLTAAYNRRFFMRAAEQQIKKMHSENKTAYMVLFDLDHFKRVNDTFGHPAGDQVLRTVADLVRAGISQGDIFARYGGEEFVLLIINRSEDDAFEMLENIRKSICQQPINFEGIQIPISSSFGMAEVSSGLNDSLALADAALYEAKNGGRNRTVVHKY